MTIAEIMGGKGKYFPGLIPLCEAYLAFIQCDRETREKVRLGPHGCFIDGRGGVWWCWWSLRSFAPTID